MFANCCIINFTIIFFRVAQVSNTAAMSGDEQVIKKPILKKPTGNPNTMDMVIEAITALDDRKVRINV